MTIAASCHCGGTRLTLHAAPERLTSCNCTFCSKRGGLWAYYAPGEVTIAADEHRLTYGELNKHHFCGKCGCGTWSDTPAWSQETGEMVPDKRHVVVNARLIDDFDIAGLPVDHVDGRSGW